MAVTPFPSFGIVYRVYNGNEPPDDSPIMALMIFLAISMLSGVPATTSKLAPG